MPAGRPTLYDPSHCERVIQLGRDGKSHAQMAAALDVSRQTLYDWADAHSEFLGAITRAKDLAQAWWEDRGQENLGNREFNASLWTKQVSCRFRDDYTDKQQTEVSGSGFSLVIHSDPK